MSQVFHFVVFEIQFAYHILQRIQSFDQLIDELFIMNRQCWIPRNFLLVFSLLILIRADFKVLSVIPYHCYELQMFLVTFERNSHYNFYLHVALFLTDQMYMELLIFDFSALFQWNPFSKTTEKIYPRTKDSLPKASSPLAHFLVGLIDDGIYRFQSLMLHCDWRTVNSLNARPFQMTANMQHLSNNAYEQLSRFSEFNLFELSQVYKRSVCRKYISKRTERQTQSEWDWQF